MQEPLSWKRLDDGLREARRFIRDAETFSHAKELIPFAPECRKLALEALDAIEHEALLWRTHREFARWRDRQRAEIHDVEVLIADGRG